MTKAPPPLLPIFRSAAQLALLTELFVSGRESSISDLARRTGVPQPTVSREIARLHSAGLVDDRLVGRTRLVRAHVESPIHSELTALLLKVAGPPTVLGELLAPITDVREAYVYGSWARRHFGEPGDEPADIDVLVIVDAGGAAVVRQVRAAADEATERLGREVSVSVLSSREWADAEGGFVRSVRNSPLMPIDLVRIDPVLIDPVLIDTGPAHLS